MGLDMYIYRKKKKEEWSDEDYEWLLDEPDHIPSEEIAYWRKHPALNKYMIDLDIDKDYFSLGMIDVNLNEELIKKIIQDIEENKLAYSVKGLFWGESLSPYDEEHKEKFEETKKRDIKAFEDALEVLQDGYEVYYSADW